MKQDVVSFYNQMAWNEKAYEAWFARYGTPKEYALRLKKNPENKVSHYLRFMGDVKGKKLANLLGSKGNNAVCFALLGAEVTVVDISEENKKYAVELAYEANVNIKYIVSDVLAIPDEKKLAENDFILLELGVLHYFIDLEPLFKLVFQSLKYGGKLILRDYHPIVSKLLQGENELKAAGDYFQEEVIDEDVAYRVLLPENHRNTLNKVKIRRWNIGEVVTAVSQAGFIINCLEEEKGIKWAMPYDSDDGIENRIPGLFTLVASNQNIKEF
ncbi:methyltransferase domain-containing protein [Bacillus sp. SM2101]|uniref:class I SAM-dependent methyltransferase n=1 Tax=Bacillus sp. SM2101 TaxID=2805366 RepID=UPI001BDE2369